MSTSISIPAHKSMKDIIKDYIDNIYVNNEVYIYLFIKKTKEFADKIKEKLTNVDDMDSNDKIKAFLEKLKDNTNNNDFISKEENAKKISSIFTQNGLDIDIDTIKFLIAVFNNLHNFNDDTKLANIKPKIAFEAKIKKDEIDYITFLSIK